MPSTLSTNYMGSTAAAILLSGGTATRIYHQAADDAIHEASRSGPAVHKPKYNDRVVVAAKCVHINSPIAAVAWKEGDGVELIRLYFIDKDNLLHEYCGTSNTSTWLGEFC
ncbi:hypothetical protein BDZ97DRAFT_1763872 [Flammula alnicola]|nr:hypothetical protein BDZ97DRAFT_1763872 [Flammula alnicola]